MSLIESKRQRILTLCGLYVAQGVPWGFMLITLPAYLSYKYHVGVHEIGRISAIILVPWSFKLIWAPIMDTFTIRSMGRRRAWIIGAEFMMAVTLLGFIGLGDPSGKIELIIAMYFIHNCFASLQDVCTDALAVDVLPIQEYGQMNGLMWGSKLVGKGVGAWALSLVLNRAGLEACVAVQVVLLLGIMLIPMFILERPGEKRFPWSQGQANEEDGSHTKKRGNVFVSLLKAFSLTTTLVYVLFTLTKLIGVGVNEIVTKTLYTQGLNPRWTDVELSTVTGLYATAPIILASLFGGILADRFGRRYMLTAGFTGYGLTACVFAACPGLWNEEWFAGGYILCCETFNAIGSVAFLSMAMRISWTKAAATVFTVYMTLSNVSHVIGQELAGWVHEFFTFPTNSQSASLASYELTFWFVGVVSILPLALLFLVRSEDVDRARTEDEAKPVEA